MATAIAAWLSVALKNMSRNAKYVDRTKYTVNCTRRATGQRDFKKGGITMPDNKKAPRCPYCGAEMRLEDNEDVQNTYHNWETED